MVDGVSNNLSPLQQYRLNNEYQEVIDALKEAFPGLSEADLEQAVINYLKAHQSETLSDLSVQELINGISEGLNVSLSAEAAATIKNEWEDLTRTMDIGVSDLVDVLDSYEQGVVNTSREFLVMIWEMLNGDLEDTTKEEAITLAEADKAIQEGKFDEYIQKKFEVADKAEADKGWTLALKIAGLVTAFIGVAATVVAGVVTGATLGWTGVGGAAAALMFVSAGLSLVGAISGTVALVVQETTGDGDWTPELALGRAIGQGLVKLGLLDSNKELEKFSEKFASLFQIGLTVASLATGLAGALLGGGTALFSKSMEALPRAIAFASSLVNVCTALAQVTEGGIEYAKAASTYQLSQSQADLVAIKALLEELSQIREMNQELTQALFDIIFQNMRGHVADSVDMVLDNLKQIAGMNLNKA